MTYLSLGKNSLFIFPNFQDQSLGEVKAFLEKEGIKVEVFHTKQKLDDHNYQSNNDYQRCFIVDQKPMAGSIVDLSKTLYVQFRSKKKTDEC